MSKPMDPNCPWNVLPLLRKGDASEEAIFVAVGHATTQWERLEYRCSLLYAALLNTENRGAADGYGLIAAFSGRKELLIAAANAFRFIRLPGFRGMKPTINEVDKFSARRNEIAHGAVAKYSGTHSGFYLAPAAYATRKRKAPIGAYAYTADQIGIYADHFIRLTETVRNWENEVRESWLVKNEGWPRPVTKWHSPENR